MFPDPPALVYQYRQTDLYFRHTHGGAELNLFWQWGGQNRGVEFKYEDAPRLTRSMQTAIDDLQLAGL